ncbi:alginate lyase family protein [Desulfofustis glycolicus]|uniref:Heparinase II/III N-terminus n=1 Tax=Desulfofustis glycolicus DSM 9705 TaxID=1121409 RepID=A0A1M5VQD7_9BACT|nr:alginate lyase family protein [Desulfofustis glycolicus]SHH77143.1 Heparinase II/III N-terminus [Desulfofustis glycolicus DSM 9705]
MYFFEKLLWYTEVVHRLGLCNVVYVAWYRFNLKVGIRQWFFQQRCFEQDGDCFRSLQEPLDLPDDWQCALLADAGKIADGNLRYYGRHWRFVGRPPNWFWSPFSKACHPCPNDHWTALKDFDVNVGDIKNIWEASRFEWAPVLARALAVSGDKRCLRVLNEWLRDWAEMNPVNAGPNWKCGQEASIRVFNVMLAAMVLRQWQEPSAPLVEFIFRHLQRIHGNIRYAIAQDNNHGTSEAAALFIGGSWLARVSDDQKVAWKSAFYARSGRKWLENRIAKLVEVDGSFSQHSVTYHRVLLDTLIFAEQWRRILDAAPFLDRFYERANAALDWLAALIDPASGGAPNLGANDGAMLLHMHSCDYRDFRPTLQTASVLFRERKMFGAGPWDEPLFWLGIDAGSVERVGVQKKNNVLPGGYVTMAGHNSWALLRFPMYRFRPSHNDVFHFDLWYQGENICRDAGSYSYNPDRPSDGLYFKSAQAHNTVCFDGQEQMPRLSRFLLAKWLQADHVSGIEAFEGGWLRWSGAYRDFRGNRHRRIVLWRDDEWVVEDELAGSFQSVEIRFRFAPQEFRLEGGKLMAPWGVVEVSGADCRVDLEEGMESLYYWEKNPVQVLVIRVGGSQQRITTRISLQGCGAE